MVNLADFTKEDRIKEKRKAMLDILMQIHAASRREKLDLRVRLSEIHSEIKALERGAHEQAD